MSDRLEYSGDPLPSGLPGFGGGTVDLLILPGFNRVVAPQKFGPVNNAPTVTPPDPTSPPGSNPEVPTPEVVTPSPAPTPPSTGGYIPNLCKTCETQPDVGDKPILRGDRVEDSCVPCGGAKPFPVIRYFTEPAATSAETGIFYGSGSVLRGKESGKTWEIDANPAVGLEIGTAGAEDGCALRKDKVYVGTTEYRQKAEIYDGSTGRTYKPEELQVCEGGTTKTWRVLAHRP